MKESFIREYVVFCKDSFLLINSKEEKSVETKLWLLSVMVSKLNSKNIQILRNGSALYLDPEDLDSNPSFIYPLFSFRKITLFLICEMGVTIYFISCCPS